MAGPRYLRLGRFFWRIIPLAQHAQDGLADDLRAVAVLFLRAPVRDFNRLAV